MHLNGIHSIYVMSYSKLRAPVLHQVWHNQAADGRHENNAIKETGRIRPIGDTPARDTKFMWDAKRQAIWLTTALALATFVVYREAHDDAGPRRGLLRLLESSPIVIVIMF